MVRVVVRDMVWVRVVVRVSVRVWVWVRVRVSFRVWVRVRVKDLSYGVASNTLVWVRACFSLPAGSTPVTLVSGAGGMESHSGGRGLPQVEDCRSRVEQDQAG